MKFASEEVAHYHAIVSLGRAMRLESEGFMALEGGDALRDCLKSGLMSYRFRVWRKR